MKIVCTAIERFFNKNLFFTALYYHNRKSHIRQEKTNAAANAAAKNQRLRKDLQSVH